MQAKYQDWLTKREAAERLGVSERTIMRYADEKQIEQKLRPRRGSRDIAVYKPADIERLAGEKAAADRRPFVMPPDEMTSTLLTAPGSTPPALRQPPLESVRPLEPGTFAELLGAAIARALTAVKPSELIFTPDEAAVYSKRSVNALRKFRQQGKLPNVGTPGHVLYSREDLDKLHPSGMSPDRGGAHWSTLVTRDKVP